MTMSPLPWLHPTKWHVHVKLSASPAFLAHFLCPFGYFYISHRLNVWYAVFCFFVKNYISPWKWETRKRHREAWEICQQKGKIFNFICVKPFWYPVYSMIIKQLWSNRSELVYNMKKYYVNNSEFSGSSPSKKGKKNYIYIYMRSSIDIETLASRLHQAARCNNVPFPWLSLGLLRPWIFVAIQLVVCICIHIKIYAWR